MNAKQIIETTKDIDLDVLGITLLSVEEAEQLPEGTRAIRGWWWLRSPGDYGDYAAYVYGKGLVNDIGYNVHNHELGVRPALIVNLDSSNLSIMDKIETAGHRWTVITDSLILCDDIVGFTAFRADWQANDANVYEASDVKKWLEKWWEENRNETD